MAENKMSNPASNMGGSNMQMGTDAPHISESGAPKAPHQSGPGVESHAKTRTLWGDAWYRLRRNKLAMVGAIWIVFIIILAVTADLWVPQNFGDPTAQPDDTSAASKLPPSWEHPFGTDIVGRDVFSRVIYGSRISLQVGVIAVSISIVLGLIMGALAAFYGGIWDSIIMRFADIFLAFPYTLFVISLIAVMGPALRNVFIAIGVLGWPSIARVFRSSIFSVKENDYISAARALGAGDVRIMVKHIFPNAMAPIIVYGTMSIGGAILTESALSFLSLGVQPPTPSWGLMVSDGQKYLSTAPWLMLFPGFAILTTVLAFTLMGDGLRDALDVKMKD